MQLLLNNFTKNLPCDKIIFMGNIKKFNSCQKNNLDAYLISNCQNKYYFTGYQSSAGILLITKNKTVFITDARYAEEASKLQNIEVINVPNNECYATLKSIIRELGIKTIGYEDATISHKEFLDIYIDGIEFVPSTIAIANARSIKSAEEIAFIKVAAEIADKAYSAVLKKLKSGITERELAKELQLQLLNNGAEDISFPIICAFSDNTALPHAHPSDRKLQRGDLVLMDFGAKYNGYCSDMTRVCALGEIDSELKKIYKAVLGAQNHALSCIKAGLTASEVDATAREYLKAQGYAEKFIHSLGHGVGLDIHESPYLANKNETLLQENMVVTIEPGVYVSGLGGVRIEDLVVVGKDGVDNLTTSKKDLIIL